MFLLHDLCFMLCSFYLNVLYVQRITGFFNLIISHCVLGGRGGRREEGGEVEMLAKFKLCHMTRNFL